MVKFSAQAYTADRSSRPPNWTDTDEQEMIQLKSISCQRPGTFLYRAEYDAQILQWQDCGAENATTGEKKWVSVHRYRIIKAEMGSPTVVVQTLLDYGFHYPWPLAILAGVDENWRTSGGPQMPYPCVKVMTALKQFSTDNSRFLLVFGTRTG